MSADSVTALQVGKRYGKPLLLEVKALAMSRSGHEFFMSANGIWLTRAVPTTYLRFPDTPERNGNASLGDTKINIRK